MKIQNVPYYYITLSVLLSNVPCSIAFRNNININGRPQQQQQQYLVNDVTIGPKLKHPRSLSTALHPPPPHDHGRSRTSLSLSPTPLLSSIYTPLASASVLALVIVIHEAGHFLAARSFGISVSEFSVGIGPKVAGFRRRAGQNKPEEEEEDTGDDDYIDFNLRAVPFGGYVRFPENYNRTLVLQMEDEKREERQRLRREEKERENSITTEKTDQFGDAVRNVFGMKKVPPPPPPPPPPKVNPLTQWWRKRNPTTTPPKKTTLPTAIEYDTNPNLLQNRPWTQRAVVLVGGIVFNLLLAYSCYFGQLTVVGQGYPRPVLDAGAVVATVPRVDGASAGILQRGDVIVAVNGEKLTLSNTHSFSAAQSSITNLISTIRSTPPDTSLSLTILPSSPTNIATPRNVIVTPRPVITDPSTGQQYTSIGVTLAPHLLRTEFIHPSSLPAALSLSAQILYDTTTQTATSLYSFLLSTLSGTTQLSSGVSGPIGVLKMGTDVISTNDATAICAFIAAISINLAVVNALPFPGLDGGQLVFVLSEGLSGRKVDQRVQEEINAYALLLLLIVSLSTTVGDVGNLMRGGG